VDQLTDKKPFRSKDLLKINDLRRIGWGTWIRTKIDGVRVFPASLNSNAFSAPCASHVPKRCRSAAARAAVSSATGNMCPYVSKVT
jgi:hypothetical protein